MQHVDRAPIRFAELLDLPGVVEEVELRSRFGFCAFHGGNLERRTELVARTAAERAGASYYGVVQPKGTRRHIPSKLVSPAESERLAAFIDHCDVVVAIHGYGLRGRWIDLLFGGRNRELASHLAHHVSHAAPSYRCVDELDRIPQRLRGVHPDNPANLPRLGGVQIELPPRIRGLTPMALHWPGHDPWTEPFPHVELLIEGLVTGARTWPTSEPRVSAPQIRGQQPPLRLGG